MIGAYYRLTKPGIVRGNLITVIAGYLFASHFNMAWSTFFAVLFGVMCVIAGACVYNNVIDRDIDTKMARTKDRATATGVISSRAALLYGTVLSLIGFFLLIFYTNILTAAVAFVGTVFYVGIYGYAKRHTRTHTLIGSIAGAVSILAGYTAYTNTIDTAGIILFIILLLWQMPHFYAIAIYRLDEYASAGIPLLPSIKGVRVTKIVIVAYIVAFIFAEMSLTLLGYTGYTYLAIVLGFGLAWLVRALKGFRAGDDTVWAQQLFYFSINVLIAFCVAISLNAVFF